MIRCCVDVRNILSASLKGRGDARVLGPAPLVVVKVNNRYRYRIIINCKADAELRRIVSAVLIKCNSSGKYKGVSIVADNNPAD